MYKDDYFVNDDGYIISESCKRKDKYLIFGKHNLYYKENIKKFINTHHKGIEFIDAKTINKNGKYRMLVTMKCICGKEFNQTWEHIHQSNKYVLCNECARKKASKNRKHNYSKRYSSELNDIGYKVINTDKELYANKLIEVEDISTGYRGFVYPNRAKELSRVMFFSPKYNSKNILYNIRKYIENNNINVKAIEVLDNEIAKSPLVKFECSCGEYFETRINNFMGGKTRCSKCTQSMSNNEMVVENFLNENNIKYIREFRINSCKDIYPLPFDFCLTDYNILIEVDGEQHFKPIRFGGKSMLDAQKTLHETQRRDDIKNEYCKKWNIPLLRLSYVDIKDETYKTKILNFIQTVKE